MGLSPGHATFVNEAMLYDDGKIACDETSLIIRRYYPWGAKTIPYASIRSVEHISPLGVRKWRLWGSGDFIHWWNLDRGRPRPPPPLDAGRKAVDTAVVPHDRASSGASEPGGPVPGSRPPPIGQPDGPSGRGGSVDGDPAGPDTEKRFAQVSRTTTVWPLRTVRPKARSLS